MKRKIVPKAFRAAGLICFLSFIVPSVAYSWSQATHAYIAGQVGARVGFDNLNEIWGSVSPDMFIFTFDQDVCPGWISDETHGTYADTFMKVWNAADTHAEEALAFGFVSHNEAWGADHIAHEAGITFGQDQGYIIAKAMLLLETPVKPDNPGPTFGDSFAYLEMSYDQALMVAHLITEYSIDIMLAHDVDHSLGRRLATAARNETGRFPALLIKAFGEDYADHCFDGDLSIAAEVLTAAEAEHRKNMIFLGQTISKPERVAEQLLAEQVLAILPAFLGGPLTVPDAVVIEILKAALSSSMTLCDDYMKEIDATIKYVAENLEDHEIDYLIRGYSRKGK